jgi:hypothetical protein
MPGRAVPLPARERGTEVELTYGLGRGAVGDDRMTVELVEVPSSSRAAAIWLLVRSGTLRR